MDETEWKVDAPLRWLWAVVTEPITYCEILPGRGFAEAACLLESTAHLWQNCYLGQEWVEPSFVTHQASRIPTICILDWHQECQPFFSRGVH